VEINEYCFFYLILNLYCNATDNNKETVISNVVKTISKCNFMLILSRESSVIKLIH